MKVTPLEELPDVLLIEPNVFGDPRGYFFESWSHARYQQAGVQGPFVQDNVSFSRKGILRGLHIQTPYPQGKLVWVPRGNVWDVAVDIRAGSPTFGLWAARELSDVNHHQLWIPPGFAHGFCVLSEEALFAYKCTEQYQAENDFGVAYNDPELNIAWPISDPLLSDKDRKLPRLAEIPVSRLHPFSPGTK